MEASQQEEEVRENEDYTIFGDDGHPRGGEDKGEREGDRGGGSPWQADPELQAFELGFPAAH